MQELPGIRMRRLGPKEPETPTGFRTVEFQREPARERVAVERVSYEHGPQFFYALVFRREGCWYRIGYDHPGRIGSPPEEVRQYLLTFEVDRGSPEECPERWPVEKNEPTSDEDPFRRRVVGRAGERGAGARSRRDGTHEEGEGDVAGESEREGVSRRGRAPVEGQGARLVE